MDWNQEYERLWIVRQRLLGRGLTRLHDRKHAQFALVEDYSAIPGMVVSLLVYRGGSIDLSLERAEEYDHDETWDALYGELR